MLRRICSFLFLVLSACAVQDPGDYIQAQTVPGFITVEIVTPDNFRALFGEYTVAAAFFEENPCRIMLQSGMQIEGYSLSARADFVDKDNADTIAHELLHCLRGRWHTH